MKNILQIIAATQAIVAYGGKNSESNVAVPGKEKSARPKALDARAELLQDKSSRQQFNARISSVSIFPPGISMRRWKPIIMYHN